MPTESARLPQFLDNVSKNCGNSAYFLDCVDDAVEKLLDIYLVHADLQAKLIILSLTSPVKDIT